MVRRALLDRGDELTVDSEAHFRGQAPSGSQARYRSQAQYDSRPLSAG